MRSDNLNWYDHGGYTEMIALSSNIIVTNEGESKCSIVNEKLLQSCSTNKNKSKHSIVNEPLLQNYSAYDNDYVLRRKMNQSAPIRKKTQRMMLNAIWRTILMYLTYFNTEETILMCHVK